VVWTCKFCGKEVESILLQIGSHLHNCDKAPFKQIGDEILRKNSVQLYILETQLKDREKKA
jgi:hypothetical protein